jgi:large subunit ribosomal protein L25
MDMLLEAKKRDLTVKAGRLRRDGWIPCCVYGHDMGSTPIQIKEHIIRKCLRAGALKVDVSFDGKKQLVAIEEVQKSPTGKEIIHIAFHALKQNEKTHMHVPLHLEGVAKGKKEGGVVSQQINELNVYGYPKDIPDEIVVDVTDLEMDGSILVKDLMSEFKFEFDEADLEKAVAVCHYAKIQEEPEVETTEVEAAEGEGAEVTELPTKEEKAEETPEETKKAA